RRAARHPQHGRRRRLRPERDVASVPRRRARGRRRTRHRPARRGRHRPGAPRRSARGLRRTLSDARVESGRARVSGARPDRPRPSEHGADEPRPRRAPQLAEARARHLGRGGPRAPSRDRGGDRTADPGRRGSRADRGRVAFPAGRSPRRGGGGDPGASRRVRQHHNVTLAILAVACTAYALLQTMVIPALPVLQRSLHTTTTWATWVLTVFLLVASVSTPILGRLGDQYGKERLLLISLALFLLGTIGCACAWNIWSLIAFRAVSAAGAGVFPLSFAIIRDEFPPDRVGVGIGLVSAVFGVGGGFGIVFAGLIVDNLSWRWLFIVGAILVAVSLVLVHRFVPESPIKTPSRVDVVGAALLSFALTALLVALSEGERWHWGSARTLGLFAASAVLFVVWGVVETRVVDPL